MKIVCTPLGMFHIKPELEIEFPFVDFVFTKGISGKTETETILINENYAVVGSESFDAAFFDRAKLKGIARFGGSLEKIDTLAAANNGIQIYSCKSAAVSSEVANLTLGFVINAAYKSNYLQLLNRGGDWHRPMIMGSEAAISIFGSGDIGSLVEKNLKNNGFHNTTLVSMQKLLRRKDKEQKLIDIIKSSNVVVLTASYKAWDSELFNHALSFGRNISLVNTARGNLVDEKAILEYLDNGQILEYFADVTTNEPPIGFSQDLIADDRTFITPHIGGYSKKVLIEVGFSVVTNLVENSLD
jgi:D-3-phosphoglycerate dehydrogenase